jgi:predicted nucleic-acid-binding protein
MIGIDTNILVRYLTGDDSEQVAKVDELFSPYLGKKHQIFVNNIVLCELIWVLESGYKYSKGQISSALQSILQTTEFCFEDQHLLFLALNSYDLYKMDFSDALIAEINYKHNCSSTFSFDQNAVNSNKFSKCY